MDVQFPRSRFGLDLLIAEAKRRMRWRRGLVVLAAAAALAALVLIVQPWGGGHPLGVAANDTAIAQIPGMTRVRVTAATSLCAGTKGTSLPPWCTALKLRSGRYEAWILTTAYEQGSRSNVSATFAGTHPGPVIVTDDRLRLASARQAEQLVREPDFNNSYSGRPVPAVNGGVGRSIEDFYFAGTRAPAREIEFFWASGPTVVNVNVIGAGLTAGEAQQIALLARPR